MRDSAHLSEHAARQAVEWAAAEGWNPGVDDAERFLAVDPDAFLATQDGDAHAGERAIDLDGVLAQQPVYASLGFELAHRNERWRGTGGGAAPNVLVPLADLTFEELAAYDAAVFGAQRDAFLRVWIDREPGHALAYVDDDRVRGYAVLRRCREGAKVGPLFADDPVVAAELLVGLRAAAGDGTPFFLDVPHANPAALEIAAASLDAPVFETARMYRNGRPPEDIARVFGVTTFELG